jgi:hypothetical protein
MEAWSLVVLIGLLLGIACTNLANLVLARGSGHQHEFAVRRALGASRWRLVREQCAESALLGLTAGIVGLGLARVIVAAVAAQVPPGQRLNLPTELTPDMLLAVALAVLVSVVVFGLWPAIQLTQQSVRTALVADGGTGGAIRWRTRQWLIVAQVAISAALVTVAATCVRSVITATAVTTTGIELDRIATARLSFSGTGFDQGRIRVAIKSLEMALSADSRIEASAITTGVPISLTSPASVWRSDSPPPPRRGVRDRIHFEHAQSIHGPETADCSWPRVH